ncbi:MAG: hypothetical protein HFJ34_02865 [Clostridia bacterium]|nr:hypothetical protein [Clostridia bacterium]
MKVKNKREKAITLISLIITIIVLLILTGISILTLTGENGLLSKSLLAKEQTIKAHIKEEIELSILEIQTQESIKGNTLTLDTLSNGQLQSKLEDITANLENNKIIGEYKDYDYTIDSDLKVIIGEKATGIKAIANVEILTEEYMFQGTVEIKLTASIQSGSIKEIIVPEGATLLNNLTDTQNNIEKIYTVTKGGNYIFKIVTDSGRITNAIAIVKNFLETPKINISNNTGTSITVNVENNYPQETNILYSYYLDSIPKAIHTEEKSYTITGLVEGTEYTVKLALTYNGKTFEIEQNIITSQKPIRPRINVSYDSNNSVITPLNYPLLTSNGVMNCKVEPKIGCSMEIIIQNSENTDVTNYYSLDGGTTWNKYISPFQTTYLEEGKILAKSIDSVGLESKITALKNYLFDSNQDCLNEKSLNKKAYDQDISSYCDTGKNLKLMIDDSIKDDSSVSFILFQHDNYRAINMYDKNNNLVNHSPNFYITSPTYHNILEFVYTIPSEVTLIEFGFSDVDVYEVRLSNKTPYNSYHGSEEIYIWNGK